MNVLKLGTVLILAFSETECSPNTISKSEQCLTSPVCREHRPLHASVEHEFLEEEPLQYFSGIEERISVIVATHTLDAHYLTSMQAVYEHRPNYSQLLSPITLQCNQIPSNNFCNWSRSVRKFQILLQKVSRFSHSVRSFGWKERLAVTLASHRPDTSESVRVASPPMDTHEFTHDKSSGIGYVQFIEADLDDFLPCHTKSKFITTVSDSDKEMRKTRKTPEPLGKLQFLRYSRNGKLDKNAVTTTFFDDNTNKIIINLENNKRQSIEERNTFMSMAEHNLKPFDAFCPNVKKTNKAIQLLAPEISSINAEKIRTNKIHLSKLKNPSHRNVVKSMCKCCRSSRYQGELMISDHIQLLKADLRESNMSHLSASSEGREREIFDKLGRPKRQTQRIKDTAFDKL